MVKCNQYSREKGKTNVYTLEFNIFLIFFGKLLQKSLEMVLTPNPPPTLLENIYKKTRIL